jgi:acetyl-CoA carboxylase carboxyl transferase subunit alpha
MLENSIYSIISPEGFASILFKDSTKAKEAAGFMKLTAADLLSFKIVHQVIAEPIGGFHEDIALTMTWIDKAFTKALKDVRSLSIKTLVERRYQHYRSIGSFSEPKGE